MGDESHGFCMKCKTYVKIARPERIIMANGRTRVAGSCTSHDCDGRISKIVS